MSGGGSVDFKNLWKRQQELNPLYNEREFKLLMLTEKEREALAKLAPETAYVMGMK